MPKEPVQIDADGDPTVTLDWQDLKVTLPATVDELDIEVLSAFEKGQVVGAVKGLFGDGYDKLVADFRAAHGRNLKVKDLTSLMELVAETYGFTSLGE